MNGISMLASSAASTRQDHGTILTYSELQTPDDDIDDFDFPPSLDDWAKDKKVCQYFDAEDESKICTTDPEYYIRGYCWDPGCTRIHTYYYCLRHYACNIGSLAHGHCTLSPEDEIVQYIRRGEIPARYQIIDWGRIGEEQPIDEALDR